MKPPPNKLDPILRPLILAGLMIAAGLIILTMSCRWRAEATQARITAESRLAQLETRCQQIRESNQLMQNALTSWDHHLRAGLSTTPDRIAWVEGLQALRSARGMTVTDYGFNPAATIDKQQENVPTPLISLTPLRVQASVAHEEKFIELLMTIRKMGKAALQKCSLAIPDHGDDSLQPQSLQADCQFLLISLRSRG